MSNDGTTPLPKNPDGDPELSGSGEQGSGATTPPAHDPWGQQSTPQQPQQPPQQPGTAYDGWGATSGGQPQQGGQPWGGQQGQPEQNQPQAQPWGEQSQPQQGQPWGGQQSQPQQGQQGQPWGGQPHEGQQPTQQFAAQPYGSQQYGGQPQGGQPGYGGGPGQPPYGPGGPGGPGDHGKKKTPVGLIVGIIVAAVVVIGLVIFLATRGGDDSAEDPTTGSTGSSEEETTDAPDGLAPEAVVEGYLTAVAEGDAETALSFVDSSQPLVETLLTDEVLAASNALAPIADISVTAPTEDMTYGGDVEASYTIGGTPVSASFSVSGDGDGNYALYAPGGSVYLPSSVSSLDVTVNGIVVEPDADYDAFIGTYQLATSTPAFTITGTVDAVITAPYESASFSGLEVALTEESVQVFHDTVRATVDACLATTTLDAGCGLAIPGTLSDGTVVTEGTVSRTLSGDSELRLGALNPSPNYDNPYFVRGDYIGTVTTTAECTKDGQVGTCDILFGPSLGAPTVDFSVEPKTVVWN